MNNSFDFSALPCTARVYYTYFFFQVGNWQRLYANQLSSAQEGEGVFGEEGNEM